MGKLQSAVRIDARRRAVPLIRRALLGSLSIEELGCVVDAQPQHVGLALSEADPSKPFAAEHFLLVAERRPMLGAEIVKAYVTLLSADLIDALADELHAIAREKRQASRAAVVGS
ncbi:hypothetical protein [Sorangium sp. So ce1024]|uniref:hypothetical protein n=1 Tax=Sorangium sp. So ce1024 TaxID=3133327 RepID=UPI003F01A2B7